MRCAVFSSTLAVRVGRELFERTETKLPAKHDRCSKLQNIRKGRGFQLLQSQILASGFRENPLKFIQSIFLAPHFISFLSLFHLVLIILKNLTGTWLAERCWGADGKLPSFSECLRTSEDIERTESAVRNVEVEGETQDGWRTLMAEIAQARRSSGIVGHPWWAFDALCEWPTHLFSVVPQWFAAQRKKSACDSMSIRRMNLKQFEATWKNQEKIDDSHSRYCEIPWANNPPMHALIDLDGPEPWKLAKWDLQQGFEKRY